MNDLNRTFQSTTSARLALRPRNGAAPLVPVAGPLYVLGGQQRTPRALLDQDQQWYDYQKGLILHVDPTSAAVTTRVEYVSPPGARGPEDPSLFKSGTVRGARLYACTQTEVMVYALPDLTRIAYISLPCFNDVHHVCPTPEGNLLVAVSGLDMVVELTLTGEVLHEWDVLGERPWTRFSKRVDYRKGISTKPHRSHPNYLCYVDDEIWVTRFEQKDAICLNRPGRRINIGRERVHDGNFSNGRLYFTTVNGNVVIANPVTLQIEQVIDLTAFHGAGMLLGWCRGLLLEGPGVWVGFSRIRPTKMRETVSWVRQGGRQSLPTHIAYYDLVGKQCQAEIDLESHGLNAIFSIFPAPARTQSFKEQEHEAIATTAAV